MSMLNFFVMAVTSPPNERGFWRRPRSSCDGFSGGTEQRLGGP
jgi:hypothetical protein